MKRLYLIIAALLMGALTSPCQALPVKSFFAAHQQTMLFAAGSFCVPFIAINSALLIAKIASLKSAGYVVLITGLPCGATLLARCALSRWTTLPDDQLLYYGAWCGVGLVAIVGTVVSHFMIRKNHIKLESNSAVDLPTDLLAVAFVAWVLTKCGTGTLRFANWIAEIKR